MARQNRIGHRANDFRYATADGRRRSLYDLQADYVLLFFNNPDCAMCKELREQIGQILGMDRGYSVILIGAGRIGQSLIENFNFANYGCRLAGAFEIRKELVGTQIAGITIADSETQDAFIKENHIDIAILSIGKPNAQAVANELIASGVKAIWNFTDAEIDPGDSGVLIENIHFSDSLLALSYYLSEKE